MIQRVGILIIALSCRAFAQGGGTSWGLDAAAGELEVRAAGSTFFAHERLGGAFGVGAALGVPLHKRVILTAGATQFFGAEKKEASNTVTSANGTIAAAGIDYQFPASTFFRRVARRSELSPFLGGYGGGIFTRVTGTQTLVSPIPVDASSRQPITCLSAGGRWRPAAAAYWGLRISYQACKPLSGLDTSWIQQLTIDLSGIIRRGP